MMTRAAVPLICGLLLVGLPLTALAEVYRWVDSEGKVHFSDNPQGAGNASVKSITLHAAPMTQSVAPTGPSADDEGEPAKARDKQRTGSNKRPPRYQPNKGGFNSGGPISTAPDATASGAAKPRPTYPHDQPETDASRCQLAKGIQNGSMVHSNGAKTDGYDRDVAKRDVRNNCH